MSCEGFKINTLFSNIILSWANNLSDYYVANSSYSNGKTVSETFELTLFELSWQRGFNVLKPKGDGPLVSL